MKKQFILDLIDSWIIAVCENKQEALICQKCWASAILLVSHRWKWETYSSPDQELISSVLSDVIIPVLARVRHWHYSEAKIAEEAWAAAIIESYKEEWWISKPINKGDFNISIISEIKTVNEAKEGRWSNFLLVWDYWSWNAVTLINEIAKWDSKSRWKIFVWWWISSPADLDLIDRNKIKWYFIWTALFHFDTEKYFIEVIDILK